MNEFLRGRVYNNLLDYYEAVNPGVNPIPELPEVVMRIYCCEYEFKSKYFDSSEECFKFAIGYNDSRCYVVDYLGTVGDRDNVVKETFGKEDSRLVSYIDDSGYHKLNTNEFNNSIDHVLHDYQGNLWVASSRQGVMKIVATNFINVAQGRGGRPDEGSL